MKAETPSEPSGQRKWQPAASPFESVYDELNSSPQGLSEDQARQRKRQYGPNQLRQAKERSTWAILVDQFKSLIILILSLAAVLSFVLGEWVEAAAIAAVILLNGAIGFFTELQAIRSVEALRRLSQVKTKVRRGGQVLEISAQNLVPGDIVLLDAGDVVTADLRLTEASKLQADESALTGESFPVGKSTEPVDGNALIAERFSMLFKGTAVTRGSGEGIAVATGMDTELGHIASLVEEAKEEATPLEKRLNRLGNRLIWVTLSIAAMVAVSGVLGGRDALLMIETSIALAIAAIPEGLPIVATLALARGMWRMAKRNALINRLSAVETLGATSIICTDKTGTLTENQMTVVRYVLSSGSLELTPDGFVRDSKPAFFSDEPELRAALEVGILCNNAVLNDNGDSESTGVGDPMEVALLAAGFPVDLHRQELLAAAPELREEAFDPEVKMMATYHQSKQHIHVAVKGAAEAVLPSCISVLSHDGPTPLTEEQRDAWRAANQQLAQLGPANTCAGREARTERRRRRATLPRPHLARLGGTA